MRIKQLSALLFSAFLINLMACTKDDKDGSKRGQGGQTPPIEAKSNARQIKVVSTDGKVVAQAQVLIGNAANQPFADNFVTTDSDGVFTAPTGWTSPATVTIAAPGYIRASYLKQLPQSQVFQLHPVEGPRSLELAGTTTGFHVVDKDGVADFGMVIQGLSKQDLFNFDIGMVISPQMDKISILGQSVNIPSNVTLPKQHESYIFPITLDKQNYRMYFPSTGNKTIFTGRGQFPLKKVVDDMRAGKEFVELVNYFTIGGGSIKTVAINGPKNSANLPVDELVFNQKRNFQSPTFDGNQLMISLALSEYQGSLFPTDVKRLEGNKKASLSTAAGSTPLILGVLKNKNEFKDGPGKDRLSATLINFDDGVQPQFLALMKDPQIVNLTTIKADAVSSINGVTPVASYAVLSTVNRMAAGGAEDVEVLTHLWEVYDPEWTTDLQLPNWPNERPIAGKKRWEVSRIGSATLESGKTLDLGPSMFEHSTHATHASADF